MVITIAFIPSFLNRWVADSGLDPPTNHAQQGSRRASGVGRHCDQQAGSYTVPVKVSLNRARAEDSTRETFI